MIFYDDEPGLILKSEAFAFEMDDWFYFDKFSRCKYLRNSHANRRNKKVRFLLEINTREKIEKFLFL